MRKMHIMAAAFAATAMAAAFPGMDAEAATKISYISLSNNETRTEPGTVWTAEPYETSSYYDIESMEWSRPYEDWEPGRKVTLSVTVALAEGYTFDKDPRISVSGMETASSSKSGRRMKAKLNYIPKVTLAMPTGICYEDEYTLAWDRVKYAGGYEVQVMRDGSYYRNVKLEGRSTTEIDLSQYATDDSLVTVKIRAIAPDGKYSYIRDSDWADFDDGISAGWDSTSYGRFTGSGAHKRFQYGDSWGDYATGWECINGTWYWFRPEDGYAAANGWQYINGQWYLFDSEGRMLTGWQKVNGQDYYLNDGIAWQGIPYGAMLEGWQDFGGTWHYFTPGEGHAIMNGWALVNGLWYLFDGNGRMLTGWQSVGGYMYCLNASQGGALPYGAMLTGWVMSGPSGPYSWLNDGGSPGIPYGAMLRNAYTPDGFYVDTNGSWRQ